MSMFGQGKLGSLRKCLSASAVGLTLALPLAPAAYAQEASAPSASAPSTNAMVNLIRLLVQQKTITQANGDALIAQAMKDAEQARAQGATGANAGDAPAPPSGTIRVPYVPETVRKQITEEIRREVMGQARAEGWAAPGDAAPDWTRRITISGDIRLRSQTALYGRQNFDDLFNYAAINATPGGFDFARNFNNIPVVNTTEDRPNRLAVRARLAIDAQISEGVEAAIRLATGSTNSPISANQILGGGFEKRDFWLDRAYLRLKPTDWLTFEGGRIANPFKSTELLFDYDLNFDGVVAEVRADSLLPENARLAVRAGAFPLDYGSADFPVIKDDKQGFPTKYLLSAQIDGGYKFDNGVDVGLAVGYHVFRNVQGQLSNDATCLFPSASAELPGVTGVETAPPTECSTDWTRAFSPTKGNTLFFVRRIFTPDGQPSTTFPNLLGLTYQYRVLDINLSTSVPVTDELSVAFNADYINNLAYKPSFAVQCKAGAIKTAGQPVTNINGDTPGQNVGDPDVCSNWSKDYIDSGNEGWMVDVAFGHQRPRNWGEWRVQAGYRYLQSDATLDSLTDSDFHLGGTNTKGYTLSGTVGLMKGASLTARWMSANEVTGEPLSIDVFQVDLLAEF